MAKKFAFKTINNLLINKNYYQIFHERNLLSFDILWNLPDPYFFRKKRYRIVSAYQIKGFKIFIKKYLAHPEEAKKEWENILLLWEKGVLTSIPVFFALSEDKRAMIGTEEIRGKRVIDIIQDDPSKVSFFISKIAEFLAKFHKIVFFHQDCYLNHFYYDEKSDQLIIIDVSRVKYKPSFSKYYFIKDLAQLGYSFEEYFGDKGRPFFQKFLSYYLDLSNPMPARLVRLLVNFKIGLIRRRTEKARAKGKKL